MTTEIQCFLALLKELQKIDAEFPLQYMICFAEIAQDEGINITALANKTGMPLSTVSRIITALSSTTRKKNTYNLVRIVILPQERRKKLLYLTPRGKKLVFNLQNLLHQDRLKNAV